MGGAGGEGRRAVHGKPVFGENRPAAAGHNRQCRDNADAPQARQGGWDRQFHGRFDP
jgi:hypothetical protein